MAKCVRNYICFARMIMYFNIIVFDELVDGCYCINLIVKVN